MVAPLTGLVTSAAGLSGPARVTRTTGLLTNGAGVAGRVTRTTGQMTNEGGLDAQSTRTTGQIAKEPPALPGSIADSPAARVTSQRHWTRRIGGFTRSPSSPTSP